MFTSLRTGKEVTESLINYYAAPVKKLINYRTFVAGGYPKNLFNIMWSTVDKAKLVVNSSIAIINDIGLEATWNLFINGYENITLICTDEKIYDYILNAASYLYNIKVEIKLLEEVKNMKFDLIIANPPYKLGHEIIKHIVENVEFDQYIDLEPVSSFKGVEDELWQYVDHAVIIPFSCSTFADAATNPHIFSITAKRNEEKTWESLQLLTYDKTFIKYYEQNMQRVSPFTRVSYPKRDEIVAMFNDNKTFALPLRTAQNGVHKTDRCADYFWNIKKELKLGKKGSAKSDRCWPVYDKAETTFMGEFSTFSSEEECMNVIKWWYNSRIASRLVLGLNKQSFPNTLIFLPKVDWSRTWTDEEILKDYGYTEEEIKEILA